MKFIVGLAVSLLSGLGIGGGGLLVIYLVFFEKAEQLKAQGINLLFFVVSSLFALSFHMFKRNIPWEFVALLAAVGTIGAYFASVFAMKIDTELIKKLFGIMLAASGTIAIFKK